MTSDSNSPESSASSGAVTPRAWYRRIGPGLITACVVIGPGSILSSSKVGAVNGYALSWVVVVAVLFMMVYTMLGAKLGVVAAESPGNLVSSRAGRWLALLIGIAVFFISASFQFGNNLGVDSAFKVYVGDKSKEETGDSSAGEPSVAAAVEEVPYRFYRDPDLIIVLFNALSIAFLFAFRRLYQAVEKLMMLFVALMLLSFAINLGFAFSQAPGKIGELLGGFIPSIPRTAEGALDISVLALVGTTFVITASYFQAYLVRQKGWGKPELRDGLLDARVGSVIMALITLMIMSTAATVFHQQKVESVGDDKVEIVQNAKLESVQDVAVQLKPLFGESGQALFCLGLFSAAYSSFLVNSMIAGFILSDGLGLGSGPRDVWPRLLTTLVLVTGMGMALLVIKAKFNPVPAIVAAQAVTVVAAPLVAGVLLWLTNRRDIMGDDTNGPFINVAAALGLVLLLAMAWYTAWHKIPEKVKDWRESQQTKASAAISTEDTYTQPVLSMKSGG